MRRLKAFFWMFLRSDGMDVASAVDASRVFVVFLYFFQKRPEQSKGVVQPVGQKLRQPFLSKAEKPIVSAHNLAQIWHSFCLRRCMLSNCYCKIIKMMRQRPLLLAY